MKTVEYDRAAAAEYAMTWAYLRNPRYLAFDALGGDCTNFVSQCVYAGCRVMNRTPVYGWYYDSADDRTASWSGVEYFCNFITTNEGEGPFGRVVPIRRAMTGDVVQLGDERGRFYHSLIIAYISGEADFDTVRVCAHDFDANLKLLSSYSFAEARFIHIEGARVQPLTESRSSRYSIRSASVPSADKAPSSPSLGEASVSPLSTREAMWNVMGLFSSSMAGA